MNKTMKKILTGCLMAVFILSASLILSSHNSCGIVNAATYGYEKGTVSSTKLVIRRSPSSSSKAVITLKKGASVKCLNLKTTWVKVSYGDYVGYSEGKYIKTAYGTASQPYANIRQGTTTSAISIYYKASSSSAVLKKLGNGTVLLVLCPGSAWVKVKSGSVVGYAQGKYITFADGATAANPNDTSSAKGLQIVAYAKKFLGNRYVWGGTSLTNGTDCSGFTMRIFQHFGYHLPRTSYEQRSAGTRVASVSQARPGDLICYYGHVAIYMGNNMIIHASNPVDGIKISYNASYRAIASIRRIIK